MGWKMQPLDAGDRLTVAEKATPTYLPVSPNSFSRLICKDSKGKRAGTGWQLHNCKDRLHTFHIVSSQAW